MNWVNILFILLSLGFFSCTSHKYEKATDPVSAGREFIDATKTGDFNKAEIYLLKDEKNIQLLENYRNYLKKKSAEEKLQLKNSSLIVNKIENLNDSTTIISCQNSSERKPMELKLVKKENEWWVDFKYTFSGNLTIE